MILVKDWNQKIESRLRFSLQYAVRMEMTGVLCERTLLHNRASVKKKRHSTWRFFFNIKRICLMCFVEVNLRNTCLSGNNTSSKGV